jgi:DNA-binding FadR family transcriptional regulator
MLMEGAWPQGERLEALRLADDLGVSMTPVRDCLNRLVGERLVDMKPGEGYRVPRMSEQALREMLDVNAALLDLALVTGIAAGSPSELDTYGGHYADRLGGLFEAIAVRSRNTILCELVRSLSERFHGTRIAETQLLDDPAREIDAMEALYRADHPDLRACIQDYHVRRRSQASAILLLLA